MVSVTVKTPSGLMPEYFYLRFETLEILSDLGLSSAYACVHLRVELVLRSDSPLKCNSEGDIPVDLHLTVLADKDGAHIVFVAHLRGEGCGRPAPRHPCG